MCFVTEIQENCSLLSGRKVVKEAFDILQPVPRTYVVDNMSSAKHAQVYKANDCLIPLTPKSSNYKSVYNVDSISHKWRWNWFHHQSMKFKLAHKKEGSSEVGTDQSGILKVIILNF